MSLLESESTQGPRLSYEEVLLFTLISTFGAIHNIPSDLGLEYFRNTVLLDGLISSYESNPRIAVEAALCNFIVCELNNTEVRYLKGCLSNMVSRLKQTQIKALNYAGGSLPKEDPSEEMDKSKLLRKMQMFVNGDEGFQTEFVRSNLKSVAATILLQDVIRSGIDGDLLSHHIMNFKNGNH